MIKNSKINQHLRLTVQAGIGLIELLISMLIGLFVMAGVVQMFATTTQNSVAASGSSRLQENIRYAFYRIREDVSQAGNLGCLNASYVSNGFFKDGSPINNMLGLNADAGEYYSFDGFVFGDESATNATFPGAVAIGTDTINVRYVSHVTRFDIVNFAEHGDTALTIDKDNPEYSTLQKNQVVVSSDCNNSNIFMITNEPDANGVIQFEANQVSADINAGQFNKSALVGKYFPNREDPPITANSASIPYLYAGKTGAYQYFIGTSAGVTGSCHVSNNPQNCSLFRRANASNQELVPGVNDMQVEYGWTNAAGELIFADATGVNDQNAWAAVDRVTITLSFNSINNVVSNGNSIDERLERTISQTFNLPNQL